MQKNNKKKKEVKKVNKWIYWVPRVLAILFILFFALFSLDVFDMQLSFWGTLLALLIHNIPSIVLAIILAISWKYEIVGGVAFILAGFAIFILTLMKAINSAHALETMLYSLIILVPAFLIGILFLVCWWQKRKK